MHDAALAHVRLARSRSLIERESERTSPFSPHRIRCAGKFFRAGDSKWMLKGLTYGPFAPNSSGLHLPDRPRLLSDLRQIRGLSANAIRLYHPPDISFLDDAADNGLRVMIDVPWEKHRCFLEDYAAQQDALDRVRKTARGLGRHAAVFAISVANEIPKDVVRFYGVRRVERFIEQLIDEARQEAPECLFTYTNYPSTEFLQISNQDFCCFNVYLDDPETLGKYLDHLQHVAGPRPLVLGEYGLDSIRNGPEKQAGAIASHLNEVSRRGLAGSFIFSFTDEWFTGGHAVTDWAFGVTDISRVEKPAAKQLKKFWNSEAQPRMTSPMVSVVVCSYNGAATLRECLNSLVRLEYPNYEIILVDDGSTDNTPEIAVEFPEVRYVRQVNLGLSAARNVGATRAKGEIVAYTDSDCVADEAWLNYLVRAMLDEKVDAMGGPNLPPPTDSWTAKYVAASPGGPSHVMFDDHRAEHIPGCNMAFRRSTLLGIGGFDVQFRQAGDDVDICWRLLDAGFEIGFCAGALVWHHRRNTIKAYLKQQTGYGRAEAMLHFKHPDRFNSIGCSRWHGIIYGEGAVGLEVATPAIYHGRFGSGLFQIVYRRKDYTFWSYFTLLEWHAVMILLATLALASPPVLLVSLAMLSLSLIAAARSTARAPLPKNAPFLARPIVFGLYLIQPVVRAWRRYEHWLKNKRLPNQFAPQKRVNIHSKSISHSVRDLYWLSSEDRGREAFLDTLVPQAIEAGWKGNFHGAWNTHDLELLGGLWHKVWIHTATEELGWPRRFTRVRCSLRPTTLSLTLCIVFGLWTTAAIISGYVWALSAMLVVWMLYLLFVGRSRRNALGAAMQLVWNIGMTVGLTPVSTSDRRRKSNNASSSSVQTSAEAESHPPSGTTAIATCLKEVL